ncbi:hypothetical protein Vqi01_54340 [Micromonospora qiuiae]|uniref:Uncharacterized protein n=1 Tax=Micromonospora qiuiae TaxID=502268 RepID=A0ABQ4JI66_9ACTN|nr:hypothetical protein Vqi01_54340 [Micromonospora qiuiae]
MSRCPRGAPEETGDLTGKQTHYAPILPRFHACEAVPLKEIGDLALSAGAKAL